jgi:hypothetical protein
MQQSRPTCACWSSSGSACACANGRRRARWRLDTIWCTSLAALAQETHTLESILLAMTTVRGAAWWALATATGRGMTSLGASSCWPSCSCSALSGLGGLGRCLLPPVTCLLRLSYACQGHHMSHGSSSSPWLLRTCLSSHEECIATASTNSLQDSDDVLTSRPGSGGQGLHRWTTSRGKQAAMEEKEEEDFLKLCETLEGPKEARAYPVG